MPVQLTSFGCLLPPFHEKAADFRLARLRVLHPESFFSSFPYTALFSSLQRATVRYLLSSKAEELLLTGSIAV